MNNNYLVHGAGLGFRRESMDEMQEKSPDQVGFMEVAPENWIGVGGHMGKVFREFTERFPFIFHGLSLSIGGPTPLDEDLVRRVGEMMKTHNIRLYSEHLTYCSDDGHLYDLMPIPFTEEAADYVAERVMRVQDILGQRIAIENGSYYTAVGKEMEEIDFLKHVLEKADCDILLDVNNIYVNSINHRYDAVEFLKSIPAERISYAHVAGHYEEAEDLRVDTHGSDVIDPVWRLLATAYDHFGTFPTLLERDFNIPPLADLLREVDIIIDLQNDWKQKHELSNAHG